jgi:hypothetical protein
MISNLYCINTRADLRTTYFAPENTPKADKEGEEINILLMYSSILYTVYLLMRKLSFRKKLIYFS